MNSGLGVRWPLSPYATALAAGAFFAFCLALWKRHIGAKKRTGKDLRGQIFGKDLDPQKEQNVCEKPTKEKSEAEDERTTNFPVLAFRDVARRFNYEHLCLPGQFGAIPRNLQRNQTSENPNLCSALRRKNVKKETKNWQEISPTSSNFASIYQQSFCFASELPRLNARFLLNISPNLQSYVRHFGNIQDTELTRAPVFGNFDVAIKPEILSDKPITRSAVCLALDRQLHKYLEEPFRELRYSERAIQTVEILDDEDEDGTSGNSAQRNINSASDISGETEVKQESSKCTKNSNCNLWDSGYGEKEFNERCTTPKERKDDDDSILIEKISEDSIVSESLDSNIYSESLKFNADVITDVRCSESTPDELSNKPDEECSGKNTDLKQVSSATELISTDFNVTKCPDFPIELSPNLFDESDRNQKTVCENLNNSNQQYLDAQHIIAEKLDVQPKSPSNTISDNSEFPKQLDSPEELNNSFDEDKQIREHVNPDVMLPVLSEGFPEFLVYDLNSQSSESSTSSSDTEIYEKELECLKVENNVDESDTNQTIGTVYCSDHNLIQLSSIEENICEEMDKKSDLHIDSETSTCAEKYANNEREPPVENLSHNDSHLEPFQNTVSPHSQAESEQASRNENLSLALENVSISEKSRDLNASTCAIDEGSVGAEDKTTQSSTLNLENSELERIQNVFGSSEGENSNALSATLETKLSEKRNSRFTETAAPSRDVTEEGSSRDSRVFDEKGTFNLPRQMDRETGERSVAVESTVTTETTLKANGDTCLSTAVVSRLTLDDWSLGSFDKEDSVSVKTTVHEEVYRPTFEEFVPLKSGDRISKSDRNESFDDIPYISKNGSDRKEVNNDSPSSPRVDRLKGLISRDEQRRSRTKYHHLTDSSHVGGAMEGEWDRLLRDVLASVSELERWERRHCDVSSDAEDAEQQHHFSQSDSSFTMEEEALSPKGETPTKVKSLRFKLDPDIFDVPSDDSFYDDNDEDNRRGWKKQPKYRAFSSLELHDEPVKLVSVHASVVPAGQKMVARPVGIDLRVRLTEERQSKRAHVSTSPSQAKRRSPVSDRGIGWCQELSPVTENVDWRETFTPVTPECKSVPNGILKTPSPKIEPTPIESPNPFKLENGVTNGVGSVTENKHVEKPKYNGWKPPIERKPFLIIRKKFEPDPEAIERITGYKSALSKPPLPPPLLSHKINSNLILRNRAEQARKQYLDNKAALANSKVDGTKKFQQFLNQAQSDRARIVTSVPDLVAIERAVTEQWTKERKSTSPRESPGRDDNKKTDGIPLSRGNTPDDKWASYVQSCRQHLGRRSQSMTYLETDIDIIPVLDEDDKCHSTSALDEPDEALPDPDDSDLDRSREDLDDSGRAKSEHELRIERSLRSLPVPEWYRRSDKTKTGFLLGSSNKEKRGWAAVKSLASSTSSLASCGLRRPVRSLRSSRENIPWSRSSASPDGPTLSLALAKAFREPYLGWRARTPTSSGVSSSPRASPPSWNATTTDDEANNVSFDGEDAFGRTTSSEDDRRDEPLSLDDTGADAVTVSMDTNDPVKLPGGEDTCDDINNMSMDTCELFDASVVVPVDEDPSPQADTGDDIDNLSTDTTTTEGRKLDPKLKRYSYSQSIYHSEWDEEEESRGDRKGKEEDHEQSPSSPDHKVVWIESSFVGSRTTTSIVVMPDKKAPGSTQERPASR